ncbi:Precorrin-2 dehydrogenase [Hyphodiscus hymeniophilus]|uniref:precorrin-2 dehydrogenase n=1 Tax=Hyphodiscus hymeniophilus TaxID=353542 RepID=A0A9P6SL09_9HELO|nr:Precorrin-2 dehydrogenase [Hyphodiscus hymeniophilus]
MSPRNDFVWIWSVWFRCRYSIAGKGIRSVGWYGRGIIRFEDIKTFEFLIYDCQWLEFLRFDHLLVEPILDFVLFNFREFLVGIIEMSGDMKAPTISSLQIGQTNLELAAVTAGPPLSKDTLELKSWLVSGNGDVAKGEAVESLELRERVLSDGDIKSFLEVECPSCDGRGSTSSNKRRNKRKVGPCRSLIDDAASSRRQGFSAQNNFNFFTFHAMGEEGFPDVEGGGSLILAWQIRNKRVLVVGGGEVAAGRILNVLNADAKVTVVSPREGLNPEVAYRIEKGQVDYVDRKFNPSDLDDVDMVLTAVDDPEASTQIWQLCKERKIAANIADVPPECDFYFGSVHRDGPLQIMVSTNGKGPRLANIVRRSIAANLPENIGEAITKVGKLRQMLRKVAPDIKEGPKRMAW